MVIHRIDDGLWQEAHGFASPKCDAGSGAESVRHSAQKRPAAKKKHRLGMSTQAFVVELLKLTRMGPVTRPEIRAEMGIAEETAYEWVAELVAGGLLVEREIPRAPGQRGYLAVAYELSPEWGGRK